MRKIRLTIMFIFSILFIFLISSCGESKTTINIKTEYSVSFVVDSNVYQTSKTNGNENIVIPSDPQKDYYKFEGWFLDNNSWNKPFTEDYFVKNGITSDTNIYARWTPIEYTATFMADGTQVGTATYTVEDSVISNIPNVPEKNGYEGKWEDYTIQPGGLTINASYSAEKYTITYTNTKGTTNHNVTEYYVNSETITLIDISKEGYQFNGWYSGNEKVESIEKGSYGNLELEARWTPIEYTATFMADGTQVGTATYTVEDSVISNIPSVPEKNGYEGKWEDYTIQPGGLTINASYSAKKYTITYTNTKGATNNI